MKISLIEPLGVSRTMIEELSKPLIEAGHSFTYYDNKTTDVDELIKRSEKQDIVMIANNPYPKEVVDSNDSLKMLAVAFTGIDHVATNACKEKSVMVCNCAGYSDVSVAELCIGMAIDLYRLVIPGDKAVRTGGTSAGLCGKEIRGKKVGIIGCGNIGLMTAKLFKAFGASVVAYSRTQKEEVKKEGIEYVSLEKLLSECDIVSLHLPNNANTKGMIGEKEISLMKKNAIFINCARGPIVDNVALANALNEGKIAGAGIDVFDMEPPIPSDYPLVRAKNTILTPHVAFLSEEAMVRRAEIEFSNVKAFVEGNPQNVCEI